MEKLKKVLFVATVVRTHIMEFHIPYLKMFKEMGWQTAVAAKNDYENPQDCIIPYCDKYYNINFERNPLSLSNYNAYKNLKKIIDNEDYQIIHCHTPVGGVLTRIAALTARKKGTKVYYTAHGFHFFNGAPLINWLLYYPIERFLSSYTDVLITINKEDYERAQSFNAKNLYYIPGVGVDLEKFNTCACDIEAMREEMGIKNDSFVILSLGKIISEKNHKTIIETLAKIKNDKQISNVEYLVYGDVEFKKELQLLSQILNVSDQVHFLDNKKSISELYYCSNLLLYLAKVDGLPSELFEAMACGLPLLFSNNKENISFIKGNDIHAEIINSSVEELSEKILSILCNKSLYNRLSFSNFSRIKHFDLSSVVAQIKREYPAEFKKSRILNIYLGQKLRYDLGIPLDAKVILSVGEVNKNKNHKLIIKALSCINDNNLYYVVCGKGSLIKEYELMARKLGINNRIIFTGYREDVETAYYMSDVFVFPSLREGLPVALMEALSCGLPSLVTKVRGNEDLVKDEKLYIPKYDYKEAAKKIEQLLDETQEVPAINYENMRKYSLEYIEKQMKQVYFG